MSASEDTTRPVGRTILEPVETEPGRFDVRAMARAEPGVPTRFRWRGREFVVAETLSSWRETEKEGGIGESYVRRHAFRIRTTSGEVMVLSGSRGKAGPATRWVLRTIESEPGATPPG